MLDLVRDLSGRIKRLRKTVRALDGAQVRRKADRDEAQSIVDSYFRTLREQAQLAGLSTDVIEEIDDQMHALLDLSHKHSAKTSYDSLLLNIAKSLVAFEKSVLSPQAKDNALTYEPTDLRIVQTLSRIHPSAARAYEQALRDLMGPDRLSWRGPATDLRECLREVLDHLAPDKEVMGKDGFKLEKNQTGPTMKQKVRFILSNRGVSRTASKAPESTAEAVDEIVGGFVRSVYTRSSVSTHTPTVRDEVHRVHTYVRAALSELLEISPGI